MYCSFSEVAKYTSYPVGLRGQGGCSFGGENQSSGGKEIVGYLILFSFL